MANLTNQIQVLVGEYFRSAYHLQAAGNQACKLSRECEYETNKFKNSNLLK